MPNCAAPDTSRCTVAVTPVPVCSVETVLTVHCPPEPPALIASCTVSECSFAIFPSCSKDWLSVNELVICYIKKLSAGFMLKPEESNVLLRYSVPIFLHTSQ